MPQLPPLRTSLLLALLACTAFETAAAQGFSESGLRRLFKIKAVDYDTETESLRCAWPFTQDEELRAFDLRRGPWLHDGRLRMPGRSAVILREITFRPPLHLEIEVRLARPSSILEFQLVPTGSEPVRPIAFVNRPVRGDDDVAVRTDGLVGADGGIRGKVVGGVATAAVHGQTFTVLLDVQDGRVGVSCDGAPPQMLAIETPALFSLLIVSPRGGVDLESLALTGEVPRRSLEKLVNTGKTIARDERSDGDDDRLVSRGFGAEWQLVSGERDRIWKETLERVAKGDYGGKTKPGEAPAGWVSKVEKARKDRKASTVLRDWRKQLTGELNVSILLGLELIREGKADEAAPVLREVVERQRRQPPVWRALGMAHLDLDEPETANECFEVAYSQARGDWRNNAFRGLARLKMGDFDRARNYLRAAGRVKDAPESLDRLVELAQLLDKGPFGSRGKSFKNDEFVIEANVDPEELKALAAMLGTFREYMKEVLPLPVEQLRPSRVWVFDSKEEYMSFTAKLTGRLETSLGVYYPPLDTLLLFATMSQVQNLEVLFHEAFHQYLDVAVQRVPRWFNEGHAEYFGATKFDEKGAAIPAGMQDGRLTTMRVHLAGGNELVPLADLMGYDAGRFMSGNVSLHYAQSWAFVHFLRHRAEPAVRELFEEYVEAILDGDVEAAYRESFGTMTEEERAGMEGRFAAYVNELLEMGSEPRKKEGDGE